MNERNINGQRQAAAQADVKAASRLPLTSAVGGLVQTSCRVEPGAKTTTTSERTGFAPRPRATNSKSRRDLGKKTSQRKYR